MKQSIINSLEKFRVENSVISKGPLCVVLVLTRTAIDEGLPLDSENLKTDKKGQVKGLGKSSVQKILKDHGINSVLASEGGRTSRGSMSIMENYVSLLNNFSEENPSLLKDIESWWVEKVRDFFRSKPFKLSIDKSKTLSNAILLLISQAEKRQKENPGMMYTGALMQHLVGAKLQLVLPGLNLTHQGFSVSDASTDRDGDFILHDTVIHVTGTPTESLIDKCKINIEKGYRPIIITRDKGVASAQNLSENKMLNDRIEIFEINQFISLNLYEHFSFNVKTSETTLENFVKVYNQIIESCETDPSLRIEIG